MLLANIAGMYAVYHGPDGLRAIAERVARPHEVARRVGRGDVVHDAFFDTVTVRVPERADDVLTRARAAGINLRRVDGDTVGISLDETTTPEIVADGGRGRSVAPGRRDFAGR